MACRGIQHGGFGKDGTHASHSGLWVAAPRDPWQGPAVECGAAATLPWRLSARGTVRGIAWPVCSAVARVGRVPHSVCMQGPGRGLVSQKETQVSSPSKERWVLSLAQ